MAQTELKTIIQPFDNFVNNFGERHLLENLKSLLSDTKPCLINICPADTPGTSYPNPYSEQARKGGLGKTKALEESWKYFYWKHNLETADPGGLSAAETRQAEDLTPVIELAEQITTKASILKRIVEFLCNVDPKGMEEIFSQQFPEEKYTFFNLFINPDINAKADASDDYDPSYVAVRLFHKSTKGIFHEKYKDKPIILFFDAFDAQYLGETYAPLRQWLLRYLFPYLVGEMGIKVFVSGREKIQYSEDSWIKKHIDLHVFEVRPFDESGIAEYLSQYPSRQKRRIQQPDWDKLFKKEKAEKNNEKRLYAELTVMTEGKPIFLDFLADLIYRECIQNKRFGSVMQLVEEIANAAVADDTISTTFKKYVIGRLHTHEINGVEHVNLLARTITIMAVARHGLTPEEFLQLKNPGGVYDKAELAKTTDFFQEVFTRRSLSYVKNRNNTRLLHDEVIELFTEYFYENKDTDHKIRNTHLDRILTIYENYMQELHPDTEKYKKRLLEYIDYAFAYYGERRERQAVNRYLYEFSYYIDRHPDLCSRLIEKGRRYYILKMNACLNATEPAATDFGDVDTLTFSKHFELLTKLRLREADYCLTERGERWDERIEDIAREVESFIANDLTKEIIPLTVEARNLLEYIINQSDYEDKQGIKDKFFQPPPPTEAIFGEGALDAPVTEPGDFALSIKQGQQRALLSLLNSWESRELKDAPAVSQPAVAANWIRQWLLRRRVLINQQGKDALAARIGVVRGERLFWKGRWKEGKTAIMEARRQFYLTGDSHGVLWAEHLLGFEAQRNGRFKEAMYIHRQVLRGAIYHFPKIFDRVSRDKTNYAPRYRLRFLLRIITRTNGNLAVCLRYEGKLLDAIRILSINQKIAQLVGLREVVRCNSNSAQFHTIMNRTPEIDPEQTVLHYLSNFTDPLLPRRLANTNIISEIKKLGTESRIYHRTQADFFPENYEAYRVDGEIEGILNDLQSALLAAPEFLDVTPPLKTDIEFNAAVLLSEVSNKDLLMSWFRGALNRELADMYYQYGKMVMTAHYAPAFPELSGIDPRERIFEVARRAFENARFIANRASFHYLEMEASEALYRLSYLSPQHREMRYDYRQKFQNLKKKIREEKELYGPYHDLISKFYVTEGDFRLEEVFKGIHISPENFDSVFDCYTKAMLHGHLHNQERYLLILDVFTARLRQILSRLKQVTYSLSAFVQHFEAYIRKSEIHKKDNTFPLYLTHFLRAMLIEYEGGLLHHDYNMLRDKVSILMRKGKFIKAANINECLIKIFARDPGQRRQLFLRYFIQLYCLQGANRPRRVEILLNEISSEWIQPRQPGAQPLVEDGSVEWAIFTLAEGALLFRSGEFWNMEKFLRGELKNFSQKVLDSKPRLFSESEEKMTTAIKILLKNLPDLKGAEYRPLSRLVAEGLVRLGELFVLQELPRDARPELQKWLELNLIRAYPEVDAIASMKFIPVGLDDSPGIYCLNCAYFLARATNDQQRMTESLQCIAMARYFMGEKETTRSQSYIKTIIKNILKKVHQQVDQEEKLSGMNLGFPVPLAKAYIVAGDIQFFELFRPVHAADDPSEPVRFELLNKWKNMLAAENFVQITQIQAHAHQMLWHYLDALNALSDRDKPYDNYHFKSFAFEINRRILMIQEPQLVGMFRDDLHIVWEQFSQLGAKTAFLDSLTNDIAIHEIALSSEQLFNKII